MVGILLALQVSNWNEQRKERVREQSYLKRLKENLQEDKKEFTQNVEFYQQVFDYGQQALAFTNGIQSDTLTNWDVLVSFFHASQIWRVFIQNATFEELKSAGELSLLQDEHLTKLLSYYYTQGVSGYNETIGIIPPYRKMVRGLIPGTIQNYMWDHCHETFANDQALKSCPPAISEEEALKILNLLRKDEELIKELRFFMSSIKVGFNPSRQQINRCDELIERIDANLIS